MTYYDHLSTPIGLLEVTASEDAITSILFVDEPKTINSNSITGKAISQLDEYFKGMRKQFELPLDAKGTAFQKTVWRTLETIEHGHTKTYKDIANLINNPKGVRAVGLANGKNPMTIVVPCHRVIGSNGSLTGYAFGIDKKAWLLNHEKSTLS